MGCLESDRGVGRIVPGQTSRRAPGIGIGRCKRADQGLDLSPGHRTGTKQAGSVQQGNDGGFQTDGAGPAVQTECNSLPGLGHGGGVVSRAGAA